MILQKEQVGVEMRAAADGGRREAVHFSSTGMIAISNSSAASTVVVAICLSQAVAQVGKQQGRGGSAAASFRLCIE